VMGRGWLDSPAGALVSQPRLSGLVHFGFISRYRKRLDVPKGDRQDVTLEFANRIKRA